MSALESEVFMIPILWHAGQEPTSSPKATQDDNNLLEKKESILVERLFAAGDVSGYVSITAVMVGMGMAVAAASCGATETSDMAS
eukprot:scaffold189926_cov43-Prasinocladus_malaysianus.AAC.1